MELERAETILGLCERFGCLPSQLYKEEVEILRLIKIASLGTRDREEVG